MRRSLQIAVGIAGFVPFGGGLAGVLMGSAMAGGGPDPLGLDSHVRYLSGLLLGIGLVFWGLIPGIERHGTLFRVLTGIVFLGGLGRLFGLIQYGLPPASMLFGLVMELVVTPILCLWQALVARRSNAAQ